MAISIDNELNKYWPLLTKGQKESLLSIIKSIVIPVERISIAQYNREIDQAVKRVKAGEYLTQDEVEKLSKDW